MNSTKKEILDLAEGYIRTNGYNAFSYKDISTALNIKNAAVHYHFPSKSELGCAVIERNRKEFEALTTSWKDSAPKTRLNNFIKIYEKSDRLKMVCFMGGLSSSYSSLPLEMREQLKSRNKIH